MDLEFLPPLYSKAASKLSSDKLYEIRLREGFPVKVKYDGQSLYLSENGVTKFQTAALICKGSDIKFIIDYLTESSLYAFNESIKKGFLPYKNGVRIGICGSCVYDDRLITVKNIKSLNIRVPHNIYCCDDELLKKISLPARICNTLIISPPYCGKTTLLKAIALKLNATLKYDILILDERGEFESVDGECIDKIVFSDKSFGLDCGIRTMSPNVVITDEIISEKDWQCVKKASDSGTSIIASIHANNIKDVIKKEFFIKNVFERYVVIENVGDTKKTYVYDEKYNIL